ncbi:MAG: MBL fold metallo-hydrolase [Ktedonobacterales bacterium]
MIESLRLSGRTAPLRIWALTPVLAVARQLVATYDFELELNAWPFDVSFHPVASGEALTLGGWPARIVAMDHSVPSAGLRLELPGGAVAYTCDTQPTPGIAALGAGARLLIAECTYPAAMTAPARASKHLTAAEAGQAATDCGVATLALVHLGPWPTATLRVEAAAVFAGNIVIPDDGDQLPI